MSDIRAYPDPQTASVLDGRKYFQATTPKNFKFKSTEKICDPYMWKNSYTSSSYPCIPALKFVIQKIFELQYYRIADIIDCYIIETVTQEKLWVIKSKPASKNLNPFHDSELVEKLRSSEFRSVLTRNPIISFLNPFVNPECTTCYKPVEVEGEDPTNRETKLKTESGNKIDFLYIYNPDDVKINVKEKSITIEKEKFVNKVAYSSFERGQVEKWKDALASLLDDDEPYIERKTKMRFLYQWRSGVKKKLLFQFSEDEALDCSLHQSRIEKLHPELSSGSFWKYLGENHFKNKSPAIRTYRKGLSKKLVSMTKHFFKKYSLDPSEWNECDFKKTDPKYGTFIGQCVRPYLQAV